MITTTSEIPQYGGNELAGSYPGVWDSPVLYPSASATTHPHVNEHGLYRQPCALIHQR